MVVAGSAAEAYVEAFEELTSDTSTPAWVQSMRRAAFDRFGALGFPTTKNEDWHFTSVSPIVDQEYVFLAAKSGDVGRDELAPFTFGAIGWHTMVFVNGRFAPELSDIAKLPNGVKVWDLATALNTAFMIDGAVVQIAKDTEVDRPIHLPFITDATAAKGMMHPRNLILVG